MSSTYTKLQVINNALNSIGERSVSSSNGILGNLITSSLQEAIYFVCNSTEWSELLSIVNASSWSVDRATMPDRTYRIRDVYWYTSPDGSPESTYDYPKKIVKFITLPEYETLVLYPYENAAARPIYWTQQSRNLIKVNPYPNDATEKSKVFFQVYRYVNLPSSDTSTFECTDLLLNLIQYKLTELLALKHLNDTEQAMVYKSLYNELLKSNIISDSGVPSYNMYQSRRR